MKTKGHSNARVEETAPFPTNETVARIPIEGGASPYTVKPLPPLGLRREEWEEIGDRMGWSKNEQRTNALCIVKTWLISPDLSAEVLADIRATVVKALEGKD